MSNAEVKTVVSETKTRKKNVAEFKISCTEKDVYTPEEVAQILHVNKQMVYELIRLPVDPIPARQLKFKSRGYLIMREELNEWIRKNAPLLEEVGA